MLHDFVEALHNLVPNAFCFYTFISEVIPASNRTTNMNIREEVFKIVCYVLYMNLLNK
jgi:hypothetical protein